MAKYLITANYTQSGLQGLLKDGGSKRREVVDKLAESLNCEVESMYYAFGDTDLFLIVDAPDNVSVAATSLIVSAAGGVNSTVTVLLTPEELDAVSKKSAAYTAPGQ